MSATPIARRVIDRLKRVTRDKVVDLSAVIAGKEQAGELQKSVATAAELRELHPAHAAYVYVQNLLSVMAEQLTALDEMQSLVKLISKAEEEYMPSGPPMSPLTRSFFTCWAFFDAGVGAGRETIGSVILKVGVELGVHPNMLELMRAMQNSRMGLYAIESTSRGWVQMRGIGTDAICRAICPSGYPGATGELWYARVLPPPLPGQTEFVVFTTPYVLLKPGEREWLAYFDRVLPNRSSPASGESLDQHMKWGPQRHYWNEFVFEGYVNHRSDAIYLAGLPDVPESRPHSRVSRRARGE